MTKSKIKMTTNKGNVQNKFTIFFSFLLFSFSALSVSFVSGLGQTRLIYILLQFFLLYTKDNLLSENVSFWLYEHAKNAEKLYNLSFYIGKKGKNVKNEKKLAGKRNFTKRILFCLRTPTLTQTKKLGV